MHGGKLRWMPAAWGVTAGVALGLRMAPTLTLITPKCSVPKGDFCIPAPSVSGSVLRESPPADRGCHAPTGDSGGKQALGSLPSVDPERGGGDTVLPVAAMLLPDFGQRRAVCALVSSDYRVIAVIDTNTHMGG